MKRTILLACLLATLLTLLLPAASPAAACGRRENDVDTPWRPVGWDDFKGRMSERNSLAAARIATALVLDNVEIAPVQGPDGRWSVEPSKLCVFSRMNKLESGFVPGRNTEKNLAHEQAHFDLTEVFARRLHQRIAALSAEGESDVAAIEALRTQIRRTHDEVFAAWQAEQARYDGETAHGTRPMQQKKWLREIRDLLATTPPIPR